MTSAVVECVQPALPALAVAYAHDAPVVESRAPAEVVDAKTSVDESSVAVQATTDPLDCKFTSYTRCCEFGVPGGCSQGTTVAGSSFCCGVDTPCDMPVAMPRQTPMIQRVQKTVEVPKIQNVDKIVEAPVVVTHQPVPVEAEAFLRVEDISVGTPTVSRKRKLSMETESADGMSDSEHGLVQGEESRSEMEETRERHAAGEDLDLLPVAPNMEAGGSHLQVTAEEERIVDWTQDLREIRRMVEFLVRRERELDVKADVAVRRLARLEKEHSQLEDEERVNTTPQNNVFSRCKSVHKMATGKSDDELIQLDDKMRIWTRSGKFIKVENPELSMAW